jgi:hypothetical protein
MDLDEVAGRIARGHAKKHWPALSERELAGKVRGIFEEFKRSYPPLGDGRKIYQAIDGTIVIVDPQHPDSGTVFLPDDPSGYFDRLVENYYE